MLVWSLLAGCIVSREASAEALEDGDLVFQKSRSQQSTAIRAVSSSEFTHVGVVFHYDGAAYVLEAVQPVRYTRLDRWAARGSDGDFVAMRPKQSVDIAQLRSEGEVYLGRDYDRLFGWDEETIYCSELVYKMYASVGLDLGGVQRWAELDLSHPAAQALLATRNGGRRPQGKIITPAALMASQALRRVE